MSDFSIISRIVFKPFECTFAILTPKYENKALHYILKFYRSNHTSTFNDLEIFFRTTHSFFSKRTTTFTTMKIGIIGIGREVKNCHN